MRKIMVSNEYHRDIHDVFVRALRQTGNYKSVQADGNTIYMVAYDDSRIQMYLPKIYEVVDDAVVTE